MQSKSHLRSLLKSNASSLDPTIAFNIAKRTLQLLQNFEFNALGVYNAIGDEPRIDEIIKYYQDKKKLAMPKIFAQEMEYVAYKLFSNLEVSSFNTLQPIENQKIVPDVALIPGMAFDIQGYRLGYGQGHYDKYLAKFGQNVLKIGLCQSNKILACINRQEHDIKMDYLVTETEIIKTC